MNFDEFLAIDRDTKLRRIGMKRVFKMFVDAVGFWFLPFSLWFLVFSLNIWAEDIPKDEKEKKIDWMEIISVTNFKEGITRYVFKNDMRVILRENHTIPSVSILGIFRVGSLYEQDKINSGLSHILEHMAFKGTSTKSAEQIQKEIQEMGGANNAYTFYDRTGYVLTAKSQFIEKALTILKEQLMDSVLDEKELAKEREVVVKELQRTEQDPWAYLVEKIYSPFVCPTSHCRYGIGGDIHQNRKVTREELIQYYKRYYNPNRFVLAITGDFKEKEVVEILRKLFKDWEPRYVSEVYIPEEDPPQADRQIIVEFENIKDNAKFILSAFKKKFTGVKESIAYDILSEILAGGRTSRLYNKLVEEEKILSDISFECDTKSNFIGCEAYGTIIKPQDLLIAKEKIIETIYDLAKNPPTQEEFEKVLKSYALSQAQSLESPRTVLRNITAGELAENNPVLYLQKFDDIKKVTLQDVINAHKEFFTDDLKFVFGAVVPKGYRNKFEQVHTEKTTKDEDVRQTILGNGIQIVARQNNAFGYGVVNFAFDGSAYWNQNPKKTGIIGLTFGLLPRGTKTKDRKTIDNEFEKLGTSLSVTGFSSEGHRGYSFAVLKDDLDKAIELLAEILLQPSFPEDEFNKLKELTIADIKEEEEEPFSLVNKVFSKRFYPGHIYSFHPTVKTIRSITLQDVKDIYNTYLKPDKLIVVSSGPWSLEELKTKIEKYFGRWEGKSPTLQVDTPSQPRGGYVFMKKKGLKTTTVMIAYRGPSHFDSDRFAGIIFSNILEPPSVGGRFFNRIREKEGMAYVVGGGYYPSALAGTIEGYAQIDSKNVRKVLKLFKDELNKFKNGEITDKEITDAITAIENSIYRSLITNSSYANLLTTYKILNRPLDYYKQILESLRKVKKEDIINFAKKYIDHSKSLMLVLYPAEKKSGKIKFEQELKIIMDEIGKYLKDHVTAQKIFQSDMSIVNDLMNLQEKGQNITEKDLPQIKNLLEKIKAAAQKLKQ